MTSQIERSALFVQPYFFQVVADKFFEQFEKLKEEGKWQEIIILGKEAIEEAKKKGFSLNEAKIITKMASIYFYQGNYEETINSAKTCQELQHLHNDPNLLVTALYLESAGNRGLAGKEKKEFDKQEKLYKIAVEKAKMALDTYKERHLDDKELLAKVYYNLGAAEGDNPSGNLEDAENNYRLSIHLFEQLKATDDIVRVVCRLVKVNLLQGNIIEAESFINFFQSDVSGEKNWMHFELAQALVFKEKGNREDALKKAKSACERANKLNALEDKKRIEALIDNLLKS